MRRAIVCITTLLFIFAYYQQVAVGRRDGADRRIQPLALKAGAGNDANVFLE